MVANEHGANGLPDVCGKLSVETRARGQQIDVMVNEEMRHELAVNLYLPHNLGN
jgi:hypothetical protein